MRLYEIQAGGVEKDLDKKLKNTASSMDKPFGDEGDGMGDDPFAQQDPMAGQENSPDMPPGGDMPDGEMGDMEPPEEELDPIKPIDPSLMASVKGLKYVSEYDFNDESKIAPARIMGMGLDELKELAGLVQTKMNMSTLSHEYSDSPAMQFYHDLSEFVQQVIAFREANGDESEEDNTPVGADK